MNSFVIFAALFCALFTVEGAPANYYAPAAPIKQQPYQDHQDYKFAYAVKDDQSYNQQSREETKYGNTVTGHYTVLEPNGELRVVNYIADDQGFRAEVQKQPQYSGGYAAAVPVHLTSPYPTAQLRSPYPTAQLRSPYPTAQLRSPYHTAPLRNLKTYPHY